MIDLSMSSAEYIRAQTKRRRQQAYADPITGSDRYFVEASRMQLTGVEGWEEARDKGIARYLEIQAQLPYPTAEPDPVEPEPDIEESDAIEEEEDDAPML